MDDHLQLFSLPVMRACSPEELLKVNEKTAPYGLTLSQKDAAELIQTRSQSLQRHGRIEFGGGMIQKLIETFSDSPYLNQQNYAETINQLVEIFYYYKNESLELLTDRELLYYMKHYFNTSCRGSTDLLQNRELDDLAHSLRFQEKIRDNSDSGLEEFYIDDSWEQDALTPLLPQEEES